jgi:catechol 2,3-dioxygenase-like lactoylglutathione lyase family enzyme
VYPWATQSKNHFKHLSTLHANIKGMDTPMNVRRIGFLATRTTNYQPTADFFQGVLGLQTAWTKPDWAGFRLPSGQNDFIEVYGPTKQGTNLLPDSAIGPIVAFIVDDVVGARAEIIATNIEVLSEVIWAAEGFGWFFLRAPDGNIYCIEQVPE